jgi:plastocyanin
MSRRTQAVVALLAAGTLAGCASSSSGGSGGSAAGASAAPATSPSAAVAADALTIAGFSYSPTPLTVRPGQVVTVTNSDSVEHTVTSDLQGLFDAAAEHGTPITFKAPMKLGTYTFHCAYHASMHGTLVVASG